MASTTGTLLDQAIKSDAVRQADFAKQNTRRAIWATAISAIVIAGFVIYYGTRRFSVVADFYFWIAIAFNITALVTIYLNSRLDDRYDKQGNAVFSTGPMFMSVIVRQVYSSPNSRRRSSWVIWAISLIAFVFNYQSLAVSAYNHALSVCNLQSYSVQTDQSLPFYAPNSYVNQSIQAKVSCMHQKGFVNYRYGDEVKAH